MRLAFYWRHDEYLSGDLRVVASHFILMLMLHDVCSLCEGRIIQIWPNLMHDIRGNACGVYSLTGITFKECI